MWKVPKWHKINFPRKWHEHVKVSQNSTFCITEELESAKCTKPYEYPLQIGWISTRITQSRLSGPKRTFPQKGDFGTQSVLCAKRYILEAFPHFPELGLKTLILAMFQALEGSQNLRRAFPWLSPPKVVKCHENCTFGEIHPFAWKWVEFSETPTFTMKSLSGRQRPQKYLKGIVFYNTSSVGHRRAPFLAFLAPFHRNWWNLLNSPRNW